MPPSLETEVIDRDLSSDSRLDGIVNDGFIDKDRDQIEVNEVEHKESFPYTEATVEIDLTEDEKEDEYDDAENYKSNTEIGALGIGDKDEEKKLSRAKDGKYCKRYWGLALGILSSLILSLSNTGVKLLNHYDPLVVCYWRFLGLFFPSVLIVGYGEIVKDRRLIRGFLCPFWKKEQLRSLGVLILRTTVGTGAYVLFNISLHYMSLSDSTVITFSTPVFVTFLARIFLKEHCGLLNVLAALVTFVGVAVIVRPPFLTGAAQVDTTLMKGAGIALASMVLTCGVYLCLRVKAVTRLNFSVVTLVFGFLGSAQCAVLAMLVGTFEAVPRSTGDWLLVVSMAFATFLGQVCATVACKYEEAGIVSLTRTMDVMFAFVWQWLFISIYPNMFSLIGSGVIVTGIFLIVLQKYLRNLPVTSPTRKKILNLI